MSLPIREIIDEALKLSAEERAELIEQILRSFDGANRPALDALWARESEDRIDAYERGEIDSIPAAEVFRDIGRKV
jgi:putative addiction module component (TIGR02574 family)